MRDILTIAASLVILVLTIALVGPWFVDWTAHRGWVEAELSRVSGARVQVSGPIDLKLLPVPRLELQTVHVSSTRGEGPSLDVASVKLELAAASLLRGELRFTDAEVERPQLTLLRYPDGSVVLPRMPNFAPSGVQVEKISWRNGSLAFRPVEDGTPFVVGGLDFTGEAASLIGPFKGSGVLRLGGEPIRYRFNTAQIEGDRLRLKAIVDESALAPRADLDGALTFKRDGQGVKPTFEGTGAFSATDEIGGAPVPWKLSGPLKADTAMASLEGADLRAGDEERAIAATGGVTLAFAPTPQVTAQFAARQLDFDRLFAGGQDGEPAGRRLAALASGAVADPSLSERLPFPVSVALTSPAATLAGETLTDLRAELALAPGAAPRMKLAVAGPARSSVAMDGAVETGAAAAFRGRIDLSLRDLPRFSDWLEQSLPGEAKRLRDLPFRALDLAGEVEFSSAGALGRKLSLRLDRSQLAGTMAFTRAAGRERARLFADLTSDALDLDGIPELAGPTRLAADMDLSLSLEARAVRLERFGAGFVDAGRIGVKLTKDAGGIRVERFAIENIGGANLSATARIDGDGAQVDAKLDAARLGDLASLVQRVAPGPFADALAKRATALSPARLTLAARGAGADPLEDIRIEGTARGTKLEATAKGRLDALESVASAENADAVMLLRQLGFDTLPLAGVGPGRIDMRAKGGLANGFETSILAKAARGEAAFDGRVSLADAGWKGEARLRTPDATPILRALAVVLPDADASLGLDASAKVQRSGKDLSIADLSGVAAGVFVNGALRAEGEGEARRWSGQLKVDRLALPTLAALALGPMPAPLRGALWPEQKLSPGLPDAPRADLRIEAGAFDLSEGLAAQNAAFDFHLAPGSVSIDGAQMALGGGKLAGGVVFRRDGATASIAGKIDLANAPLPAGPVSGALSGHVEFTSTGQTYAALAGGLAGGGRIEAAPLDIAGADAAAITRLIRTADAGGVNIDETEMRARLAREMEAAPLTIPRVPLDMSIAAGVARLASPGDARPRVEIAYDMRQLKAEARVALAAPAAPKDWSGALPAATVVWQGRLGAMQRSVEAAPLLNAISARAIAREAARVEALEADIRERAYFNRRQKAFEFMRQREREVAAFEEEQRRAQAEAAKRADEAKRAQAEEARRQQAEDAKRAQAEEAKRAQAEEARRRAEQERLRARPQADNGVSRVTDNPMPQDAAAQRRRASEILRQRAEESLRAVQPRPPAPIPAPHLAPAPDPLASGPY